MIRLANSGPSGESGVTEMDRIVTVLNRLAERRQTALRCSSQRAGQEHPRPQPMMRLAGFAPGSRQCHNRPGVWRPK